MKLWLRLGGEWKLVQASLGCSPKIHPFSSLRLILGFSGNLQETTGLARAQISHARVHGNHGAGSPPPQGLQYMELIPKEKQPVTGTEGALYRRRQLMHQLPIYDQDPSRCRGLLENELKVMEEFVKQYKSEALGVGEVALPGQGGLPKEEGKQQEKPEGAETAPPTTNGSIGDPSKEYVSLSHPSVHPSIHASGLDENAQVRAAGLGPQLQALFLHSCIHLWSWSRGGHRQADPTSSEKGHLSLLDGEGGLGGGGEAPSGLARVTRSPPGLWALQGRPVLPSRGEHALKEVRVSEHSTVKGLNEVPGG